MKTNNGHRRGSQRPLVLHKETLRRLSHAQLAPVAGGHGVQTAFCTKDAGCVSAAICTD